MNKKIILSLLLFSAFNVSAESIFVVEDDKNISESVKKDLHFKIVNSKSDISNEKSEKEIKNNNVIIENSVSNQNSNEKLEQYHNIIIENPISNQNSNEKLKQYNNVIIENHSANTENHSANTQNLNSKLENNKNSIILLEKDKNQQSNIKLDKNNEKLEISNKNLEKSNEKIENLKISDKKLENSNKKLENNDKNEQFNIKLDYANKDKKIIVNLENYKQKLDKFNFKSAVLEKNVNAKEKLKNEINKDINVQIRNEEININNLKKETNFVDLPQTATHLPNLEVKDSVYKEFKSKKGEILLSNIDAQIYLIENEEFEKDRVSKDLLNLYKNALEFNSTWIAAKSQNLGAQEKQNQAYADLLPFVNLSGTYTRSNTKQKTIKSSIPYSANTAYDSYNFNLNIKQPLFRKYNLELYKQRKIEGTHADYVLEQEFQDLAVRVSDSYFKVLLAKADLQVSKLQRKSYEVYLEYANKIFTSGVGTRTDIDDAKAKLDNEIANESQLQYQYDIALSQLSTISKQELKSIRDLDFEKIQFISPQPNILKFWQQQALLFNPKILAAQEQIKIADKEIQKAKAGYYPTLDLVAYTSRSQSDSTSTINSRYNTSALGFQFNIPIYDGGKTNSAVKQAGYFLKEKQALLDATQEEIKLQVKKEFDMINQSLKWIKAYQISLISAKQAIISNQKGFQAGTRNRIDVLNAQQNLAQVKLNLNKSIFDYITSRIRLLALTGQLNINQMSFFNTWFY